MTERERLAELLAELERHAGRGLFNCTINPDEDWTGPPIGFVTEHVATVHLDGFFILGPKKYARLLRAPADREALAEMFRLRSADRMTLAKAIYGTEHQYPEATEWDQLEHGGHDQLRSLSRADAILAAMGRLTPEPSASGAQVGRTPEPTDEAVARAYAELYAAPVDSYALPQVRAVNAARERARKGEG
jgi:hypothetical protein